MKDKIKVLLMSLVIFSAAIISVQSQEKAVDFSDVTSLKATMLPRLIENKADLASGVSIFEFYCPLESCDLNKMLSFEFIKDKRSRVDTYAVSIEQTRTIYIPIYERKFTKVCTLLNGSKFDCYDNVITGYKNLTETYWESLAKLPAVKKGTYRIRMEAKWKPAMQTSIDWLPTVDMKAEDNKELERDISFTKSEWAWWNTTWSKCKPLTISISTGSLNNLTYTYNVTYDSDMQADFDDIRFVTGTSCSDATAQIGQYLVNKTNSQFANFELLAPSVNATIYMYYGSTSAVAYSNRRDSNLFFDDFSEAAINTTLWYRNMTAGTSSISGGYLSMQSGSTSDSGDRYCSNGLFPTPLAVDFDWATRVTSSPVRTSEVANFFCGSSQAWYLTVVAVYYNTGERAEWVVRTYNANQTTDLTAYVIDTWYHENVYGTSTLVNIFTNVTGTMSSKSSAATNLNTPSQICLQAFMPGGWQQSNISYDNVRAYTYTTGIVDYSFGAEESYISDSTPPDITWNSPSPGQFNQTYILWNVTVSETGGASLLDINSTTNYSMSWSGNYSYYNLTSLASETVCGKVYASDALGNMNMSSTVCANVVYVNPPAYNTTYTDIFAYDEKTLAAISKFTATLITATDSRMFGINSSFISYTAGGTGSSANTNRSFDNDKDTYGYATATPATGARNDTWAGYLFLGNSKTLCGSWNYTATGITYYLRARQSNGTWLYIGLKAGTGAKTNDCFAIEPSNFDDMVYVNVTTEIPDAGGSYAIFEIYPGTFNISSNTLSINQSVLVEGNNRIDIADVPSLYYPRTYYQAINLSINSTLKAYLPSKASSIVQAAFSVQNQFEQTLSGATINIQKIIGGNYATIGSYYTDATGLITAYLIENDPYRLYVTYGALANYYSISYAQAQTYIIYLTQSTNVTYNGTYSDIYESISPLIIRYNSSLVSQNYNFTYTIYSNQSQLSLYGMILKCNGTVVYQANVTIRPAGGQLFHVYDVVGCSNITMDYYFQKGSELIWKSVAYPISLGSGYGLYAAMQYLAGGVGLGAAGQMFVFVLLAILVGSVFMLSPEGAAFAQLTIGGMFVAFGIIPWGLYIVMTTAVVALMFMKRRL